MTYKIYKSDGQLLCEADSLEYYGEFMGERYVSCSVSSSYPIGFKPGDYVDYRGERFTIPLESSVVKSSSRGSSGDAFRYEGIKFKSRAQELSDCMFLDYVKSDNLVHYSSLPVFNFYAASVKDLADRIQENLNRLYTGERSWSVQVAEDAGGEKDVNIIVEHITCWDALGLAYSKFGLFFFVNGRKVTIGGAQQIIGEEFSYGFGHGLYEIESVTDPDQQVITRLKVYGSTRNMPIRYYNNLMEDYAVVRIDHITFVKKSGGEVRQGDTEIFECTASMGIGCDNAPSKIGTGSLVRIPGGVKVTTGTEEAEGDGESIVLTEHKEKFTVDSLYDPPQPHGPNPFVEEESGDYHISGVRVRYERKGVVKWEIYMRHIREGFICSCSNDGETLKETRVYQSPSDAYASIRSFITGRPYHTPEDVVPTYDEFIQNARYESTESSGITVEERWYEFEDATKAVYTLWEDGLPSPESFGILLATGGSVIEDEFLTGNHNGSLLPDNMAVQNLMLPEFPYQTLDPYLESENAKTYGVKEGYVYFDGSDEKLGEIFPSIEEMTAQDLIDAGVDILPPPGGMIVGSTRMDSILGATGYGGDGVFEDGAEIPNFTIYLRDMGFDLVKSFKESGECSISIKSGECSGMEFKIASCVVEDNVDAEGEKSRQYVLSCEREQIEGSGTYAPNDQYKIASGNLFVLLGISMPDVYVKAAAQRLRNAGRDYLKTVDHPKKVYTPKIDEIEMARQHDNAMEKGTASLHDLIVEGMRMPIYDEDILGGRTSVTIDTLSIKEKEGGIPTYEVTLRDDKEDGILSSIQSQVDGFLAGNAAQGSGGGNPVPILKTGDSMPASDANVYSAARTDAEIRRQTAGMDAKYLSRVRDDRAKGKLGFDGGFEVGPTVDSLTAGRGILADVLSGRMQMQRLEVRGSMTVMDLIVNEIHAMMGDFSFSDAGKIDYVEEVPAGAADEEDAYWLWLRKETEADLTTFAEGDVVYSIVNTLRIGGTDYYTSWMRVAAVDLEENRILAVLYPDAEVPGGVNYPPVAGYNLTRRGNNVIPESGTNERAQSWLISSREGRMMFLANVYKPVLEDYNYALVTGKLPPLPSLRDAGVPDGVTGVMADWVVAANFREYDYNGDVRAKLVFRGDWSADTAKGASPYRNVGVDMSAAGGGYTLLERHTVRHAGCLWGCIADKTEAEPKWNSTGWTLMEGNDELSAGISSTRGTAFFARVGVDTELHVSAYAGKTDITGELIADPAASFSWSRDSGNAPVDAAWKPTYVEEGRRDKIRVLDEDMGPDWLVRTRQVSFTVEIYVPDRAETLRAETVFKA